MTVEQEHVPRSINTSEAGAACDTAEAAAAEAETALSEARDAFSDAVADLEAAAAEKDAAGAARDALVPTADAYAGALDEARAAQAAASDKASAAEATDAEAAAALSAARERMDGAQEEYDSAHAELEKAREAERAASDAAAAASALLEDLDRRYGETKAASDAYEEARAAADEAQRVLDEARGELEQARQRVSAAKDRLDQANLDVVEAALLAYGGVDTPAVGGSGRFSYLDEKVEAVRKAYGELVSANERLDGARDALDSLQRARDDAYWDYLEAEANYAVANDWLKELLDEENSNGDQDDQDDGMPNPRSDAPSLNVVKTPAGTRANRNAILDETEGIANQPNRVVPADRVETPVAEIIRPVSIKAPRIAASHAMASSEGDIATQGNSVASASAVKASAEPFSMTLGIGAIAASAAAAIVGWAAARRRRAETSEDGNAV